MSEDTNKPEPLDNHDIRDAKGRFKPGCSGNPKGNPLSKRKMELTLAFANASTPEKIVKLEGVLYEMALGGDLDAIEAYFHRALLKPVDQIEVNQVQPLCELSSALQAKMDAKR